MLRCEEHVVINKALPDGSLAGASSPHEGGETDTSKAPSRSLTPYQEDFLPDSQAVTETTYLLGVSKTQMQSHVSAM